ncbi:MAG: hypothetical protein ACQER7_03715, partial [Bacteroidota bacterium]
YMSLSISTSPNAVARTGDGVEFKIHTTDSTADFYYICVKVYVDDNRDGSYTQVGAELKKPVDSNGDAVFDIAELLKKEVSDHFDNYRSSSAINPSHNYDYVRKYKIEYFERSGSAQTAGTSSESSVKYALQGGLSRAKKAYYEEQGGSWYTDLQNVMFLTNAPRLRKTVSFLQTYNYHFLYFMPLTSDTWHFHVRVYSSAGVYAGYHVLTNADQYEVAILSAKYSILKANISGLPDEDTVDYYVCWVENDGGTKSTEKVIFRYDNEYHEHERYYAFNNTYGLLEAIYTSGLYQEETSYNQTRFLNEDDERSLQDVYGEPTMNVNSGYVEKEWLNYFKEIFLSHHLYELFENYIQKIILEKPKLPKPKSNIHIYQVGFEYRYDDERNTDKLGNEDTDINTLDYYDETFYFDTQATTLDLTINTTSGFKIKFGDGNEETYSSGEQTLSHTYADGTEKQVQIICDSALTEITKLVIDDQTVTGTRDLSDLTALTFLTLTGNPTTRASITVSDFSVFTGITRIDVQHTDFTSRTLSQFEGLNSLTHLNLRNCNITGSYDRAANINDIAIYLNISDTSVNTVTYGPMPSKDGAEYQLQNLTGMDATEVSDILKSYASADTRSNCEINLQGCNGGSIFYTDLTTDGKSAYDDLLNKHDWIIILDNNIG